MIKIKKVSLFRSVTKFSTILYTVIVDKTITLLQKSKYYFYILYKRKYKIQMTEVILNKCVYDCKKLAS